MLFLKGSRQGNVKYVPCKICVVALHFEVRLCHPLSINTQSANCNDVIKYRTFSSDWFDMTNQFSAYKNIENACSQDIISSRKS